MCDCGAMDCIACRGEAARYWNDDDSDGTADELAEMRGLLDDAELYWEQGKSAKALQSLRALRDKLNEILGGRHGPQAAPRTGPTLRPLPHHANTVPEPGTLALIGAGLAVIVWRSRP